MARLKVGDVVEYRHRYGKSDWYFGKIIEIYRTKTGIYWYTVHWNNTPLQLRYQARDLKKATELARLIYG